MDEELLKKVSAEVMRLFPELSGVKPEVRSTEVELLGPPARKLGVSLPFRKGVRQIHIFTYRRRVETPDGMMSQVVRVRVDESGQILKITTSR